MKTLLLISLFIAPSAFAHKSIQHQSYCEFALGEEFARIPDDNNEGRVTDHVYMSTDSLIEAYRRGIFPWDISAIGTAVWYSPPKRGVLRFSDLDIPRKDAQFIRRELNGPTYTVTFDQAFEQVVRNCSKAPRTQVEKRTGEKMPAKTWIKPQFIAEYVKLAQNGQAHSVEVWRDGKMVGGLYGVFVGGVFTGESMFHTESNVIKLALYSLIQRLKAQGHTWMDTQQANGVIRQWGGSEVLRQEFLGMLDAAQEDSRPY